MKVKLSIRSRIKLSELLADQSGNFAKMKIIRLAREELSLSEEEIRIVDYKENPDPSGRGARITWDQKADPMKECEINETVLQAIKQKLDQLNNREMLREDQIELYERFVEKFEETKE